MKKVLILGAGLVGYPMAMDLSTDPDLMVTLADRDEERLNTIRGSSGIDTLLLDVKDRQALGSAAVPFDAVLQAVPGHLGYRTLETLIGVGKDVVDISFFPEDMFGLDALARDQGVTVICDMGVAPGMSHLLSAEASATLDSTQRIGIYVGGLPKKRTWPWEYQAVFSPVDVIEEYTRPARLIRGGKEIVLPALSEPEILTFPSPGDLEAFNSDGLRSLLHTMDVPEMVEKTLRYPGHIDKIRVLQASGFFDTEVKNIAGMEMRPLDFTSGILFDQWKLQPGDEDLTIMRVLVEGWLDGIRTRIAYDLYDEADSVSGVHSMARTTGYAATMVLRLLLRGMYRHAGVSPPEYLGRDPDRVHFILEGLRERNVIYTRNIEPV